MFSYIKAALKIDRSEDLSKIIHKNIAQSLIYQFFTNVLGLLVVPLTLAFIDKEKYGIWINASVMVTWLQNMNFGMGFGMQNKVAESLARNESAEARNYISLAYKYSFFIAIGLLCAGLIGGNFIDWNKLYNSDIAAVQLKQITLIAFLSFLVYFVLSNLNPVLNAVQRTGVSKLLGLFTNIVTILLFLLIRNMDHNNLVLAALALAIPTPIVYLFGNLYFFSRMQQGIRLRPFWKSDNSKVKHILGLGVKFFIMQLATLLIFNSGAFIIAQTLGPEEVTPFSLINRYFYFVYFIFSLALTPYWAAFTEMYVKKDFVWIRKTLRRLLLAGVVVSAMILLMYFLSFYLIPVWTNHSFELGNYQLLLLSSAIFTITMFYAGIFATFLNAINRLNIQVICQIVLGLLVIPLCLFFVNKLHLGSAGVNFALIICQLVNIIVPGWETYRELAANPVGRVTVSRIDP